MPDKKRILFVEHNLRNEKLGIMYLLAALKNRGHHADIVKIDEEDIHHKILDFRPDFVAFSVTTGEHITALKIAKEIKERYQIQNIFGGPHCTFFPEFCKTVDIDFMVAGQGERAIVDIVESRSKPGFVMGELAPDITKLPFPDREIFYQYDEFCNNPMKNIITSRACPYKCSYCFNHSYLSLTKMEDQSKKWFLRRSVDDVISEINDIRNKYPLEKLLFIDDNFISDRNWVDEFVEKYTQHVNLPWMCSMRVNTLDEDLAERLKNSGLVMVNYALESADPEVQQKLLNRGNINNGDIIRAISMFNRYGVRARMQNMIGLPLLNPLEDALNTLQFNMNHRVTDFWCSIFQTYPRTALGKYCVDHDFITEEELGYSANSFFDESRLNINNKKEIYALQKLWYFVIKGKIPLDLVQILIRGDFTPSIGSELQELRFSCSRKELYGLKEAAPKKPNNLICSRDITDQTISLIEESLKNLNLPDLFHEILAKVAFKPAELIDLAKYIRGEQVYPKPLYTINDKTGALLNPEVSIFNRGTVDPAASDIRNMPEEHFMNDITAIRRTLP